MARKPKVLEKDNNVYLWIESAAESWNEWMSRAKLFRAYFENRQWTAEEVAKLKEVGQPVITVNHIWSRVNNLTGRLLQQRPTIKFFPRGKNDATLSSVATKVIRYIFEINKVRRKYAEVLTDLATVGVGWIEARASADLTRDPIVMDYIPWDEIMFDPESKQPDLSDSRFLIRGKWVDLDVFKQFYPEVEKIYKDTFVGGILLNIPGTDLKWFDQRRKRVFVIEVQYKNYEERDCFWDGYQAVRYIPEIHGSAISNGLGKLIRAKIYIVRRMIICGGFILEDKELPYLFGDFTYTPFIAFRDSDGNPMGIVELLKDMQDEINKRRSKVLHYLSSKRVLAEAGAIDDPDEFMEELARPDAYLEYNKGYDVKIESELELGAQHFQLMQEAAQEMSSISGIYPDFFGMPTNARNAAAIRQRVLQSQTPIQKFYLAFEEGLTSLAEKALCLAIQYYTGERLIQLSDEPEAIVINQSVRLEDGTIQLRNSLNELRGDVVVSVVGGGITERQEQLTQLIELLKPLPPQLVMMSLDILIDAFDIPQKSELKRRFGALLQQMVAQQPPEGGNQQGGK